MKNDWELVDGEMYRLWVPTGWIVRDEHYTKSILAGWQKTETFVFDPKHEWK